MLTLLDVFLEVARSSEGHTLNVVDCDGETWTYADLDHVSSMLAATLHTLLDPKPTVSVICENHPYVLALTLATWKLNGIVAPLDVNAPIDLLKAMLANINPSVIVYPHTDVRIEGGMKAMQTKLMPFDVVTSTIAGLLERYSAEPTSFVQYTPPSPKDVCLYLHTSSATGPENIKCVPLSHEMIAANCYRQQELLTHHQPELNFDNLRVLGWCPFSHVMAYTYDIGAWAFMTRGCYVFARRPQNYGSKLPGTLDMVSALVETMVARKPDVFSCVPWVLQEMMVRWSRGELQEELETVLPRFKVWLCGGAQTDPICSAWAVERKLRLFNAIGMTELCGGLFHTPFSQSTHGWSMQDLVAPSAELAIVDENGDEADSGELFITSRYIAQRYLNRQSDKFVVGEDGRITFATGDMYHKTTEGRLVWQGRKEDFIQFVTGDKLDPRPIEKALRALPFVQNAAVVGEKFLNGPSQFAHALVEPASNTGKLSDLQLRELSMLLGSINGNLPPSVRISWHRVFLLQPGQTIPVTRKRDIFRKLLETLYGHTLSEALARPLGPDTFSTSGKGDLSSPFSEYSSPGLSHSPEQAIRTVQAIVAEKLAVPEYLLLERQDTNFSSLGMDSAAAVAIVAQLNSSLAINLPPSTCHIYLDMRSLVTHVLEVLQRSPATSQESPSLSHSSGTSTSNVVLVGEMIRLPGDLNGADAFWEALLARRTDIMSEVPQDRWDHSSFYRDPESSQPSQAGDITFKKAGFIQTAAYDNQFFSIPAAEALYVSPANRMVLEAGFEALENANIPVSSVKGSNMGIFVATGLDEGYATLLHEDKKFSAYSRFYGTGVSNSSASGRLSYLLDTHGPSVTLDTACSGGLVALDYATQYLQSSDAEIALVVAANTQSWPGKFCFLSANGMSSVNSRCATFTDVADGYFPSEAVVAFVVKKQDAALRDNDKILATITSSTVHHNGRSQGLVAPNMKAQAKLQLDVLQKAGLSPSDIDFIEAHGTGTKLGDLLEMQGITTAFHSSHKDRHPLLIGAAKSCVGHTEVAAGLVGLSKCIKTLEQKVVPGLTHLTEENLNPSIDCSVVPFVIPVNATELRHAPIHRGLLLSFGVAGTIAAAVVESPPSIPTSYNPNLITGRPCLFVVSAKTEAALTVYLKHYLEFCKAAHPDTFESICYTSCVGREHYNLRFACAPKSLSDLVQKLEDRLIKHRAPSSLNSLIFAFPGQGLHFRGMAYELCAFAGFRQILRDASKVAGDAAQWPDVYKYLSEAGDGKELPLSEEHSQLCIFVYQFSIAKWLEKLELHPSACIGHSLGEITASVISGILPFKLAVDLVIHRERLLRSSSAGEGAMAVIALGEQPIRDRLKEWGLEELKIAVYNSHASHVLSGSSAQIEEVVLRAKGSGIRAARLPVRQGFHSPYIRNGIPGLISWSEQHSSSFQPPRRRFVSSVSGEEVQMLPAHYWVEHAQQPVRFDRAVSTIINSGPATIIDMGPQPALSTVLQDTDLNRSQVLAATTKKTGSQLGAFFNFAASLFEMGATLDFKHMFEDYENLPPKVVIPTYPFQRRRHYPTVRISRSSAEHGPHGVEVGARPSDSFTIDESVFALLSHHTVNTTRLLPAAAMVDFVSAVIPASFVEQIHFHKPFFIEEINTTLEVAFHDGDSRFILTDGQTKEKASSGVISLSPPSRSSTLYASFRTRGELKHDWSHDEVYNRMKGVELGERFRNIRRLQVWDDHVDILVSLPVTQASMSARENRIRLLDSILHGMGALHLFTDNNPNGQGAPQDGFFLPSSLHGFQWLCRQEDIPTAVVCRYYLPIERLDKDKRMTVAFDVFSAKSEDNDGREDWLVAKCRKYTVAWVSKESMVQRPAEVPESKADDMKSPVHLETKWREVGAWEVERAFGGCSNATAILLVGSLSPGPCGRLFSSIYSHLPIISLPLISSSDSYTSLQAKIDNCLSKVQERPLTIVLDLSNPSTLLSKALLSNHEGPLSSLPLIRETIYLFQGLVKQKVEISSLLVLSCTSMAFELHYGSTTSMGLDNGLGSILLGMIRVLRTEVGLDARSVRLVDMPSFETIEEGEVERVIRTEFGSVGHKEGDGGVSSSCIAWRSRAGDGRLVRFAPVLAPTEPSATREVVSFDENTVVIAGMDSIASTIAKAMARDEGVERIVFLGRRSLTDASVLRQLSQFTTLDSTTSQNHCRIDYIQTDICSLSSVKASLLSLFKFHSGVDRRSLGAVIYTAADVKDATVQNLEVDEVGGVKGAWNLHCALEELGVDVGRFVGLSSISLPLANPRQATYAVTSSFLDWLAAYRRSKGLPGLSLQLGPWESAFAEQTGMIGVGDTLKTTENAHGIPVVLEAMKRVGTGAVEVIATFNWSVLEKDPAIKEDWMFREVLRVHDQENADREAPHANMTKEDVERTVIKCIRETLQLEEDDTSLDMSESLLALGIDSISFAHLRAEILAEVGMDLPLKYFGEEYSVQDVVQSFNTELAV